MTTPQLPTPHQSQYFAWLLTRRAATAAAVEPADAYAGYIARCLDELGTGADMERIAPGVVARLSGPQALPEGLQLARFCQAQVRAATWRRALAAMLGFDRRAALFGGTATSRIAVAVGETISASGRRCRG